MARPKTPFGKGYAPTPSTRADLPKPPKLPENIRRRPLQPPPMRPVHAEAKRQAAERKARYGD